jgi:hypothetical protein
MLPGPDDCWLADEAAGATSELRPQIAVDLERQNIESSITADIAAIDHVTC